MIFARSDFVNVDVLGVVGSCMNSKGNYQEERVRGIEPPCAAWEAAVLPLNYTRGVIFDFRFSIADCNSNKRWSKIAARAGRL